MRRHLCRSRYRVSITVVDDPKIMAKYYLFSQVMLQQCLNNYYDLIVVGTLSPLTIVD